MNIAPILALILMFMYRSKWFALCSGDETFCSTQLVVHPMVVLFFRRLIVLPLFLLLVIVALRVIGINVSVAIAFDYPVYFFFCFLALILNKVVVPLGLPRTAYWAAKLCQPLGLTTEIRGGDILYGALALTREKNSPESINWLIKRLGAPKSAGVAAEIALGLLAALQKDRLAARRIFGIIDTHSPRHSSRLARRIARDWLVMDAVRDKNLEYAFLLGKRGMHSHRWSYAVARISERIIGRPEACRNWQLWLLWMLAPRRRLLLPLLRHAIAVPSKPAQTALQPAHAGLPGALARLAQVLAKDSARSKLTFLAAIDRVDAALNAPGTLQQIQKQLLLGGTVQRLDVAAVAEKFSEMLVDMLVPVIEKNPHLAEGGGDRPVIRQAAMRIQQSLSQEIEFRCRDYKKRSQSEGPSCLLAEWNLWANLRDLANKLLTLDPSAEDALFKEIYLSVSEFAVFQHNMLNRRMLAYDMFSWLHHHSKNNPQETELLSKNMGVAANIFL